METLAAVKMSVTSTDAWRREAIMMTQGIPANERFGGRDEWEERGNNQFEFLQKGTNSKIKGGK